MPQTFRLVTLGLLSALAVATLTGCAGAPQAHATLKPAEADAMFLALVRAQNDILNKVSDELIISVGLKTCKALDAGVTPDQIDAVNTAQGVGRDIELPIMSVAPGAYCPKWSKVVQKWLDAI